MSTMFSPTNASPQMGRGNDSLAVEKINQIHRAKHGGIPIGGFICRNESMDEVKVKEQNKIQMMNKLNHVNVKL